MDTLATGSLAVAHNLRGVYGRDGHPMTSVCVRVEDHRDGLVWVRLNDLSISDADHGILLVLDESKVEDAGDVCLRHKDGLVTLAG